jgi:phytoene dehydrogenase-like protein
MTSGTDKAGFPRRLYDVAVIGSDPGGAATAAILSRRGLRVMLAADGPLVPKESDGWVLPGAVPAVPALRQLTGATPVLDDLGLGQELARQSAGPPGALQILGESLRLSLPAEAPRRREELRRELPDEWSAVENGLEALERLAKTWDAFLHDPPPLPARGFFERRKLRKILPYPPPDLPEGFVGEALHALAPFCASLVGDTAPEAAARQAATLLRAPLRLWGGAGQVWELLRGKAEAGGTHVLAGRCARLRVERRSALFELEGAEVRANVVVLATSTSRIAELCQGGGRVERNLIEESTLPVSRKVGLAHFVVHPEAIPQGLEEAALLYSAVGPALLACHPARRARGEFKSEKLLTFCRSIDVGDSDGPALIASARKALEAILPFFDKHIVHEAADLDPQHGQRLLRPHEGIHSEPIGVRPVSDAHERVSFASQEVYPGFGLEGSLLAARACAGHALELIGRKQVAAT